MKKADQELNPLNGLFGAKRFTIHEISGMGSNCFYVSVATYLIWHGRIGQLTPSQVNKIKASIEGYLGQDLADGWLTWFLDPNNYSDASLLLALGIRKQVVPDYAHELSQRAEAFGQFVRDESSDKIVPVTQLFAIDLDVLEVQVDRTGLLFVNHINQQLEESSLVGDPKRILGSTLKSGEKLDQYFNASKPFIVIYGPTSGGHFELALPFLGLEKIPYRPPMDAIFTNVKNNLGIDTAVNINLYHEVVLEWVIAGLKEKNVIHDAFRNESIDDDQGHSGPQERQEPSDAIDAEGLSRSGGEDSNAFGFQDLFSKIIESMRWLTYASDRTAPREASQLETSASPVKDPEPSASKPSLKNTK